MAQLPSEQWGVYQNLADLRWSSGVGRTVSCQFWGGGGPLQTWELAVLISQSERVFRAAEMHTKVLALGLLVLLGSDLKSLHRADCGDSE